MASDRTRSWPTRTLLVGVMSVAGASLSGATARAQTAQAPTSPPAAAAATSPAATPTTGGGAGGAGTRATSDASTPPSGPTTASAPTATVPAAAPSPPLEIPVPKAPDAAAGPTDHALVVGRWGVEVRRVSASLGTFALRAGSGCPTLAATGADPADTPCDVPMSGLSVRHWVRPSFAWSVGLALALGGGRQSGANLDTYFGAGPILGVTLLLGQWKHLAVGASPELTWVVFKPAASAGTVHHVEVSGALEAELHFGFIDLPALTVALRSGLRMELDRNREVSVWALGVSGPSSAWGLLNNLFVRYYF